MASSEARERAAQAWCTHNTRYKVMDPALAEAFADILDEEWAKFRTVHGDKKQETEHA